MKSAKTNFVPDLVVLCCNVVSLAWVCVYVVEPSGVCLGPLGARQLVLLTPQQLVLPVRDGGLPGVLALVNVVQDGVAGGGEVGTEAAPHGDSVQPRRRSDTRHLQEGGQPVHQVDHARVGVAGLAEEGAGEEGDPPDAALVVGVPRTPQWSVGLPGRASAVCGDQHHASNDDVIRSGSYLPSELPHLFLYSPDFLRSSNTLCRAKSTVISRTSLIRSDDTKPDVDLELYR